MAPAAAAPTAEMANLAISTAPKGTAKRDALVANEIAVQSLWESQKAFECNPCYDAETGQKDEKFIVTFPYPYSNGHLHLGHAFSLTKAVFRAQFERNRGKNSLFPFAFHCTGMPIQAVSLFAGLLLSTLIVWKFAMQSMKILVVLNCIAIVLFLLADARLISHWNDFFM